MSTARLDPKTLTIRKDLLLEVYDDGLVEFTVEFEHWCLAFGAKSEIKHSEVESDVSIRIIPTDFETALMLDSSTNDRLISKFLSWVQNWRVMDHYSSSILDHEIFDNEGNPSEQIKNLVSD